MTNQQTNKEIEEMNEWEKEIVGKNVHSVYTLCLACKTWGVNMPLEKTCGDCGNTTDTYTYYDSETITNFLFSERQRLREEIEKMKINKKKGIMEVIFGDGRKEKIRMHTNMDVGYNQALSDILKLLEE